ncbi:MAG: NADH:ubiquinone reductase (Na(+)-transporting) subunit F [Spirochaetia bacterium]
MSIKITINNDKVIETDGSKKLFQVLSTSGVFVPSACGGKGNCGLCRVRVSGGGEYTESENIHLTDEEKEDGYRLACQILANHDMNVFLSEQEMAAKMYRTKVSGINDVTLSIREITLECSPENFPSFKAGQFMLVRIPAYNKMAFAALRSYSLATSPEEKGTLKFLIRLVINGYASTYLHKYLKQGDAVSLIGPFGDFYLRESNLGVIMLAGGSGMAPMRSILKYMHDHKIARPIYFFFGGHDEDDLFYLEELAELQKDMPHFKFFPCIDVVKNAWNGDVGNVVETAKRHLTPEIIENCQGYLCGGPGMLNAAIEFLTSKGMKEDTIFYDRF